MNVGSKQRRLGAKRVFDVLVTFFTAPIWGAVLCFVAVLIRVFDRPPVFFRQTRPGYDGRPFDLIKFRSMTADTSETGEPLPDGQRITPVGAFLRKTSLDELPELLNVLKGEMSLVGPRPLLMEYLDRYTPEQRRRHEVPPGITGWAQVNGRNALTWEEKFDFDLWYVDHHSLALDVRIIAMTIGQVIRRDGISAEGHATMPKFGEET